MGVSDILYGVIKCTKESERRKLRRGELCTGGTMEIESVNKDQIKKEAWDSTTTEQNSNEK